MTEFLFFSYSFPFTICRFFNISGNRQSGANGMVLPTFVECAAKGLPIQIHNDGKQIRCFCDIRDAVSFLSQLGEKDILNREIVNVGNELNICEIGDLAKKVKAKAKSSSEIVHIPFSEVFSKQTGEITLRIPNTDKMKQFYKCQHNLDSIVQSFFE
jgi:UDP-glucose 4-epimerase